MARKNSADEVTLEDVIAQREAGGPPYPFPMERTQTDGRGDEYSLITGLDLSGETPVTRQEFKDEADINNILARYGINTPLRQMQWGQEIDERLDLQQALFAISEAQKIQVPEELRSQFPTWQAILNGVETGEYQHALKELEDGKAREKQLADQRQRDAEELAAHRARVKMTDTIRPEKEPNPE